MKLIYQKLKALDEESGVHRVIMGDRMQLLGFWIHFKEYISIFVALNIRILTYIVVAIFA